MLLEFYFAINVSLPWFASNKDFLILYELLFKCVGRVAQSV